MRLEGRRRFHCEHSSEKREVQAYHAEAVQGRECTVDYNYPPDWCHAIGTSLHPPSVREPTSLPCRSVTMSAAVSFTRFVFKATVLTVCCGVR